MDKETDVNLHIQISKELDNKIREATYIAKTVYDKDLTRKHLVTTALETLFSEIDNEKDIFLLLIGAGNYVWKRRSSDKKLRKIK